MDTDKSCYATFVSLVSSVVNNESQTIVKDNTDHLFTSPCHAPAIGINITTTSVHLVLIELYPQNVAYSTVVFQRYLLSLIVQYEHENRSLININLRTHFEQEANFRLFTLTRDEFDCILLRLKTFVNCNRSIASSYVLNIALTGEQTKDYETKIALNLNQINLNFDIIPVRAESYMIGLEFFLGQSRTNDRQQQEEFMDLNNRRQDSTNVNERQPVYPYILVHAEAASTYFYLVHSSSQYSLLTSTNLSYKTYLNLLKFIQPGHETTSKTIA
jgi:hypothetical protein